MSIVRNFNLYLNAGNGSAPYINANQYDQGEQWVFTLYKEDGTKYLPSTGAIVGIKADNRGIINTGTVDADGRVVINETQQMTAAAGIAIFELLIDGETHGTANFLVNVEQRPGDNADLSDSDLSLIQQAVDSAEVIVEVIGDGDPSEVIGEHVDAWLDNHPEATTTVQDGAITAPKINNSLWDKILVNEEASGEVASFDDGADDVPVSSLKVALEPVQLGSGDPSPTNIRPISGHSSVTVKRTGKNLFDASTITPNKALSSNGSLVNSTASFVSDFISVKETVYVFYNYETLAATANRVIGFYDASKEWMANKSISYAPTSTYHEFTVPEGAVYARISMDKNCSDVNVSDTGTSYPYTLGQNVYGGSVDLATGVLTVTKVCTTLTGNEDWTYYRSNGSTEYNNYKATAPTIFGGQVLTAWGSDTRNNAICSDYVCDDSLAYNYTGNAFIISSPRNAQVLVISTNQANTVANFKTYLANNAVQVCATLVEPQTIQLTPQEVNTLLGYNNISSTGTVDVIYHADTKLYVDKMTAVDNNIIAPTEETFTATRNYTVNDLVIVADTLYKVTANIASGSTITPNSNVTATTLGALIKALS